MTRHSALTALASWVHGRLQMGVPSASSYSMTRQRSTPLWHAAQGMAVCALSMLCVAGLISVTSPHDGHTSCLMLPCISTVRPGNADGPCQGHISVEVRDGAKRSNAFDLTMACTVVFRAAAVWATAAWPGCRCSLDHWAALQSVRRLMWQVGGALLRL